MRGKVGVGLGNVRVTTKPPAKTTQHPKVKLMPTKGNTPVTPPPPICTMCGKVLKTAKSIKAGVGHTCAANAAAKTPAQWQQHAAAHTATAIPKGYVKLATFKQIIPANAHKIPGLNINKLVKAIGRDKAAKPPVHPIAKPTYVNNVRYVHGWLATPAGLAAIASGNWDKAPTK